MFARSNVIQTVEFFDYDAQDWVQVGSENAARSPSPDSIMVVAGTGDLSRFVEDGTLCIQARVRFIQTVRVKGSRPIRIKQFG